MAAVRLWPPGARGGELQEAELAPTVQPVTVAPSSAMLRVEVSTPEPLSEYVIVIGGSGLASTGWLGEVMVSVGGVVSGTWKTTTSCAAWPELASRETKSTRPLWVSSVLASSQPALVVPARKAATSLVTSRVTVPARWRVRSAVAVGLDAKAPPFQSAAQSGLWLSRLESAGQSQVAAPSDQAVVSR